MDMRSRTGSALLLFLAACTTPEPKPKRLGQVVVPVEPFVAPETPVVLPSPVTLPPPVPLMVPPESTEPKATSDKSAPDKAPSPPVASRRRPECEPQPTPHRGGDALHNWCADTVPPNRFPGHDVLVNGKRFDALQVGADTLWEIKTDRFDTYAPYLRDQVIRNQVPELKRERDIARDCGYHFTIGVSSAAHKAALLKQDITLDIFVTRC